MNIFEDLILVQKSTIKDSWKSFIKNLPIIFIGLVYMIINILVAMVISTLFRGVLSILTGLITAIISSALISNYLYLLFNIINFNRVTLNDFKTGFSQYIWKVYGVFFITWIATYLLTIISRLFGSSRGVLLSLIYLIVFILLNSLPETIYQKHYSAPDSIIYAFEFIKDNWFNWFVPNIIFFGILYLITGTRIGSLFTTYINVNMDFSLETILRYILGQSIFTFAMIYRGHMFKYLSTSTRRKREFMRKQ